jgi:hypothetical protein
LLNIARPKPQPDPPFIAAAGHGYCGIFAILAAIRRASSRVSSQAGALHCGGHSCSTRVRCRMVSLIRGRYLTAFAKISRAFSRLLPAYRRVSTFVEEEDWT